VGEGVPRRVRRRINDGKISSGNDGRQDKRLDG
jgi:hypothetical protein